MKRIIIILVGFLVPLVVWGQAPVFEWAKQLGGNSGSSGHDIATDKDGNVYVTGDFERTTDFDPGPDTFNLTSVNKPSGSPSADIFIAKYDSDGQFLWVVSFGGDDSDRGFSIVTDTIGNVYATGYFQGSVDFDPGPGEFTLGVNTIGLNIYGFILKLDTNGSFIWAGKLDALLDSDFTIDQAGNLYLAGLYAGTNDFDIGPEVYNVTGSGFFVLKLDKDGNFLWVKTMEGGIVNIGVNNVALDGSGNIYVIGGFSGAFDFDPGPGEFVLTEVGTTGRDGFVLKLNSEGDFIWVKQIGALDDVQPSWPKLWGILVDEDSEGVYISGSFDEICDFDPGPDTFNLVANGVADFFIFKLNLEGDFIWAKSAGGESSDTGGEIVIDKNKNLYLVGGFRSMIDFNSASDTFNLSTSLENRNTFILKLDTDGNYQWVGSFFSSESNWTNSMALDRWGNIYTTGGFRVSADFDPDTSIHSLTAIGGSVLNTFIHKLKSVCNIPEIPITPNDLFLQQTTSPFEVTVPEVPNTTGYEWTVPTAATILSGQGTNVVVVDWNGMAVGGLICVSALNECGSSATACVEVTVDIVSEAYCIFPNPAADYVNIVFKDAKSYDIIVFDSNSRLVDQIRATSKHLIFPIHDLASGSYWLKITDKEEVYWERIVVVK